MAVIDCPGCGNAIPEDSWNQWTRCGTCRARIEPVTFPALDVPPGATLPESVADASEASCFYHPENRAAVPCDACGKFLCKVCDLDLDGRHLCHECLDRGIRSKSASLDDTRILYDSMALHLAAWPVLGVYLPLFTAPVVLFLAFRHMGSPSSILPRTRIRWWIAIGLAVLEIVAIVALILWAFSIARRTRL